MAEADPGRTSYGRTAYYDAEAPTYDQDRGGVERARSAASAVLSLVPAAGTCLDVGGGTGIVSAALADRGLDVRLADRSLGMLRVAAGRLPGRVLCCDATRLALPSASVDLVTTIWLLHLLAGDDADRVVAEAARVLTPGGHLVTTVDKDLAHRATARTDADSAERLVAIAQRIGLTPAGTASFVGRTRWSTAPGAEHQTFRVMAFRRGQ